MRIHHQRAIAVVLRPQRHRQPGPHRQPQCRIQRLEPVLRPACLDGPDPVTLHLQRLDRLRHHLDPQRVYALPRLVRQFQRPPQRQKRHIVRIGPRHERRLAKPVIAIPDHRHLLPARLIPVADRAIPHQAALQRVRQVRQIGLHIQSACRKQYFSRPHLTHPAADLGHGRGEPIPFRAQRRHRARHRHYAVLRHMRTLPRQHLHAAEPFRKHREIMAGGDPRRPAAARIHQHKAPVEPRQVQSRGQPRRAAANHQAIQHTIRLFCHRCAPRPCRTAKSLSRRAATRCHSPDAPRPSPPAEIPPAAAAARTLGARTLASR